jgi:hypothetical protein
MARKPPPPKNLRKKPEPARPAAKDVKDAKAKKPEAAAKTAKPAKDAKAKEVKKDAKPAPGKPVAAKEAPPKKKRSKSGGVRLKAYWGVFNQMMKRIALFEYAERKAADKKAGELGAGGKTPHFVQLVKEVIRDGD